MNANQATSGFEVVTLPIGIGWRVRISDGRHLQFVGGFARKNDAEDWVRRSSSAWLAKLKKIADSL